MLKNIKSIELVGANFVTSTSLDLFNSHDGGKVSTIRGALLYGRNGVGKSTIARAFRKIAGGDVPVITNVVLRDDTGQPITLSEDEKKHVFVFDEDFVDENVKLKQDHLETIVMLGQVADLTNEIKDAEAERDIAKTALEQQEKVYLEYCDDRNPKSPGYYVIRLKNALQGDDNWAGRDRKIRNKRQNTNVHDDTYKRFISITPSKSKTELIVDYQIKLKELEDTRSGVSIIDEVVPSLPDLYTTYDDQVIHKLLAEEIEKPELSDREKKLFSLLQSGKSDELSERLIVFKTENTMECPYCYQPLSSEYKSSIVANIEKVLNKAVEDYRVALRAQISDIIAFDLSLYSRLASYQICLELIEKINVAIRANNDSLNKKLDNPYNPIIHKISVVGGLVARLKKALESLEKERVDFNNIAKKTNLVIRELNRLNDEITHYDVVDLVEQLNRQQKEFEVVKGVYEKRKADFDTKSKFVEELELQRSNVKLALDSINACIKYIFFAEDRLKIDFDSINSTYKLLSHGRSVAPCNISVSERNIIGLSYFFTNILEGKEEEKAYSEEYMLIIDDPVSSYDIENRIGILSFLKYKLSIFLESNPNTRVLVMTHDLTTFYDIQKIFKEIENACKQKGYPYKPKFHLFELRDNAISSFSLNERQEYTEIMKNIYEYASGKNEQYEIIIGNMMRQALEAFSYFEYKKSITDVSRDTKILELMPEPEYESYYKNLMYRLVLHGGSHREEQIKTMKDFNFFSLISKSEKIRTAKDILCFIYLLNKRHLLEHLKECGNDVETTIESWCKDIKSRAVILHKVKT